MRARRAPDVRLSGLLLDRELLHADGQALPDAWISGLDDRPAVVSFGDTYGAIDLKLTPLGAYTLTGMPLSELTGA
jgi:hypothetical protein